MTDDRAEWLVINYEFGSCKKTSLTISTDMWVPVEDPSPGWSSESKLKSLIEIAIKQL